MIAIPAYCESENRWQNVGHQVDLHIVETDDDGEAYFQMAPDLYPHYVATLGVLGRVLSNTFVHGKKRSAQATVIDCPRRGLIRLHASWTHDDSGMSSAWSKFFHNQVIDSLDFGRFS